jgi:hypothetical protein
MQRTERIARNKVPEVWLSAPAPEEQGTESLIQAL